MADELQAESFQNDGAGRTRALLIAWIAALVLGVVLRIALIDRHGLWNNELITFQVMGLPTFREIFRQRISVNHMPLYFIMEKAWTDRFGLGEASMRAIGTFFGAMAVWAAGRLARRIGGLRLAVPVTLTMAVHQLGLSMSLEARMYSMLMWAGAESTDAYLAWARAGRSGGRARFVHLARWALVSAFIFHVHLLYLSLFIFQCADAVIRMLKKQVRAAEFAIASAGGLLLCIPIIIAWVAHQTKFEKEGGWEWKTPGILLRQTLRLFFGDYSPLPNHAVRGAGIAVLIAAVGGLVALLVRRAAPARAGMITDEVSSARRDLKFLGTSYLVFLAAIFIGAARSDASILGSERYYCHFLPLVVIMGWMGLKSVFDGGAPWLRRLAGVLAVTVVAIQITYTTAYYLGPGEGLREAYELIARESDPETRIIATGSETFGSTFGVYYGKGLRERSLFIQREIENTRAVGDMIEGFIVGKGEFWVFCYHDEGTPIWDYLRTNGERYEALTKMIVIGESELRKYRVGSADR